MDYYELNLMRFKSQDEASKKAEEINKNAEPAYFCPLINGKCRKDCVCWIKVSVVNRPENTTDGIDVMGLSGFFCDNDMFNAERRICQI